MWNTDTTPTQIQHQLRSHIGVRHRNYNRTDLSQISGETYGSHGSFVCSIILGLPHNVQVETL